MVSLADGPARPAGRCVIALPHLPWRAVPIGAALTVGVIAGGMWLKSRGPAGPGQDLVEAVQQRRCPDLDVAALVLRYGLSVPAGIGWLVLTGTVLWSRDRNPARALAFISLVLPGWLATAAVKPVVERPRPSGVALFEQAHEVGPHSFPSAHVCLAAGVGCAVVLVFCWHHGTVVRAAGLAAGLAFALMAGWSRVYLGVHHPGDVVGSILLTAATELIWLPVLTRLLPPAPPPAQC